MNIYVTLLLAGLGLNFLPLQSANKGTDIVCTYKQSPNRIPEQQAPTMSITYQNATGITCCEGEDAEACEKTLHNSAIKYCENPPSATGENNKPVGNTSVPEDYRLEPIAKVICDKKTLEFKKED